MSLEITTPELGTVKRTAKDLVISALMYNHPATLAKLTNTITKTFHNSVTFQGVRKATMQLQENGVVTKVGKEYSLSKDWILKLRGFVEELHESYFTEKNGIANIEAIGEDIKVYTFDNLINSDLFWNSLLSKWFDEEQGIFVQQAGHTWYVLANLEEETQIVEKMKARDIKFYTLVVGKTILDRWCKKYYNNLGFKYTIGKKKGDTSRYFGIYNDYVVQCTYPKDLTKEIDVIYSLAKDFESFDVTNLIRVLRKNAEIKLIVMKNPLIAEQLRSSVLKTFL